MSRLCLVFWDGLDDLFLSQNPKEFYASHFQGRVLACAYYYYTLCGLLTPVLAVGLSLESE